MFRYCSYKWKHKRLEWGFKDDVTSRGRVFTATSRCDCEISCCLGPVRERERSDVTSTRLHTDLTILLERRYELRCVIDHTRTLQRLRLSVSRSLLWLRLWWHSRQFPSTAFALDNQGYRWCPRVCLRRSLPRTKCARSIGTPKSWFVGSYLCKAVCSDSVCGPNRNHHTVVFIFYHFSNWIPGNANTELG